MNENILFKVSSMKELADIMRGMATRAGTLSVEGMIWNQAADIVQCAVLIEPEIPVGEARELNDARVHETNFTMSHRKF